VTIAWDAKDWIWVLDRRCPECGFEAATFPPYQVAPMIRANTAAWHEVLADPMVGRRPTETVWSALEYGCHVRDVFRVYDERLERMLTEDDPLYLNWDQDATASEDRYSEQQPHLVADELAAAASRLAIRFDGIAPDQWARTGRRSDGARFTVDSFARYMIHDPVHHLHDATTGFAALGQGR
jgi:DinB superfamily